MVLNNTVGLNIGLLAASTKLLSKIFIELFSSFVSGYIICCIVIVLGTKYSLLKDYRRYCKQSGEDKSICLEGGTGVLWSFS
jgi:hypothetical protein